MNNIRYLILSVVMGFSVLNVSAQEQESTFRYGMFNHLSIGANVGTTGWGLDAATCVEICGFACRLFLDAGFQVQFGFGRGGKGW